MRVAIYCRLSEEDRNKQRVTDDSNSIQNQKSMLLQYSIEQGWDVYNIYSDDDFTGADRRRPEFNKLLADAEAHKFDIVLCKTQSRFTRELELVEKYIHGLFPIWGIRFVSIVDNADTNVQGNKKSRQINGLVNEWQLEDLSDNIKSVLTSRRKEGHHIGAFALYGYKKDPDKKGHLIIDEQAANVVREVFSRFVQGQGKTSIARTLNARGIPNPTEYKRLNGLRYKTTHGSSSTLWKYFTISDMLINEMYIGNMVQGRTGSISYKTKQNKPRPKDQWYIVEGTHEAIIDRELWDKVQALIAQKATPFGAEKTGLFARKARCMYCGYTLRSSKTTYQRRYLSCPNHFVDKTLCGGAAIAVVKLEQYVIEELRMLAKEYLDMDELERNAKISNDSCRKKDILQSEIAMHEKKIAECTTSIRTIYMDKVRGIISERDYMDMSEAFSKDRERFEVLIQQKNKQLDIVNQRIDNEENRAEIVKKYADIDHLTREMVDALIDHVNVGRRIPGTRNVPVEIHWNF